MRSKYFKIPSILFLTVLVGSYFLYSQTNLQSEEREIDIFDESEFEETPIPTPTPIPFPELSKNFQDDFKIIQQIPLSGRIAFSVKVGKYDRILVLDLDAQVVRKVIDGPGNSSYPAWSADGTYLAFTSDRDGNKDIYLSDWDGTNQERLTFNEKIDDNAAWHPTEEQIFYYAEEANSSSGRNTNIFRINLEDRVPERITNFSKRNSTPDVSPDGTTLAYSTNRFWPGWDVCSFNLFTQTEKCLLSGVKSYCRARWAPKGAKLAYSSGAHTDIDLALFNLKNDSRKIVTNMKLREYDATWSADGKYVAFVAENGNSNVFNLYVMNLTDRKTSPLIKSPYSIRYLSWTKAKTIELVAKRIKKQEEEEKERQRALKELLENPSPNPIETTQPVPDNT